MYYGTRYRGMPSAHASLLEDFDRMDGLSRLESVLMLKAWPGAIVCKNIAGICCQIMKSAGPELDKRMHKVSLRIITRVLALEDDELKKESIDDLGKCQSSLCWP